MVLPRPSDRVAGALIVTTTCWLGLPAPAKYPRCPAALATPVTPPANTRLPVVASSETMPEVLCEIIVPKSRSSILVRVSGIRRTARPLALLVAATGAADAGIAREAIAAAMRRLRTRTRHTPRPQQSGDEYHRADLTMR